MKKLPEGWEVDILKNIIIKRKGKKPTILFETKKEIAIPYILIDQMEGRPNRYYTNDDKVPIADEDDILIVWDGSVGKVTSGIKGAIGSTIAALTPKKINSTLLKYFLITKKSEIENTSRGTSIQHINPEYFDNLLVPIPPKEIQQKIVVKLDKLMPKIRECRERLEKIPAIIKRYKQAVLNAAVTGKLTENENYMTVKENSIKVIAERIQIGPFGSQLHKSDYIEKGIPVINPMNFSKMKIEADSRFSISKDKFNTLAKYSLKIGDVILARRGEMGRVAVVTDKEEGFLCGTGSVFIRPKKLINSSFLFLVLRSLQTIEYLEQNAPGTTMKNLNKRIIGDIPFILPILEEQKEIVKRVDALYKKADATMKRYEKAKALVDKMDQSILAKAFRGELVS